MLQKAMGRRDSTDRRIADYIWELDNTDFTISRISSKRYGKEGYPGPSLVSAFAWHPGKIAWSVRPSSFLPILEHCFYGLEFLNVFAATALLSQPPQIYNFASRAS
jgi:hypothetical protein